MWELFRGRDRYYRPTRITPADPNTGRDDDCVRLCLATYLSLPLDQVPDPDPEGDKLQFWVDYITWVHTLGFRLVFRWSDDPGGPYRIAAGQSLIANDWDHVIIQDELGKSVYGGDIKGTPKYWICLRYDDMTRVIAFRKRQRDRKGGI